MTFLLKGIIQLATTTTSNIHIDADRVINNLKELRYLTKVAVAQYMNMQCEMLEAYMKANAPWKDRPNENGNATWESNARDKLTAKYEEGGDYFSAEGPKKMMLVISHGVSYGVYLENNGSQTPSYLPRRRPILEPTREKKFPEVYLGLSNLFQRYAHIFNKIKAK